MGVVMAELKECPVCDEPPEVRELRVNTMFGGGTAFEVRCPSCGISNGIEYRDRDDAIEGWNWLVCDFWEDDDEWDA